jgi:mannan endo-1,6-alpha-mannosidase
MTAAETNFQNPPPNQPQWLALAQAVYNRQADPSRHDDVCGGGMRWQIYWNTGYDYKNAISNGIFINLGARLALYTGNNSYTDWIETTWQWVNDKGIMDSQYNVYDGIHVDNCSAVAPYQFSYNTGIYLLTAATMYNYVSKPLSLSLGIFHRSSAHSMSEVCIATTVYWLASQDGRLTFHQTNGSSLWYNRTEGMLNRTLEVFFPNNIAYEVTCEAQLLCNTDMLSFKAYLTRWMAQTTKMAPFTFDRIKTALEASATAAALQCSGGANGRMCGLSWSKGAAWDGTMGVGQQMAAMEVIQSNLIQHVKAPLTNSTGGTSLGNPSAGTKPNPLIPADPPTIGDKAGAGVLTAVVLLLAVFMWSWMTI